ncbi:MAG: DUF1207 domain-containing protein [Pirellulales bacterium]|nr:DUF1207 domain-containing protein [Pirellulales bacterium]
MRPSPLPIGRRLFGGLLLVGTLAAALPGARAGDPVFWPSVGRDALLMRTPGAPAAPMEPLPQAPVAQSLRQIDAAPVVLDPAPPLWYRRAWQWQVLPEGLLYKSYLAGVKESRFAAQWAHERNEGWIWDIALGGRVGVLRYGTEGPVDPEGWQIDMEGAGLPRLDLGSEMDLVACDYRFGVPITYARGQHQTKFGYYHLSSHLGDEWMIRHPGLARINYGRDALVLGHSINVGEAVRVYAEAAWAFQTGEGTEPWEFQFGAEYSPRRPTGLRPAPFLAINGHLREEVDFGGNVTVQAGWQWRGATGHLFRMGLHYFTGMSDQFEFHNRYESKIGLGIWYDY